MHKDNTGGTPPRDRWRYVWEIALIAILLFLWWETAPLYTRRPLLGFLSLLPLGAILFIAAYEWSLHRRKQR